MVYVYMGVVRVRRRRLGTITRRTLGRHLACNTPARGYVVFVGSSTAT